MRGALALGVIAAAVRLATGTDAEFANVQLLLHGGGANGSTTIVDSSSFARTSTGTATISTDWAAFGTGSINFGGARIYSGAGFVPAGDFCFETEFLPGSTPAAGTGSANLQILYHQRNGSDATRVFLGYANWTGITSGPGLWFQVDTGGSSLTLVANGTLSLVASSHIAITRSGNVWRLFVNGIKVDEETNSIAYPNPGGDFWLGEGWGGNFGLGGKLDEVRFTNGAARYTADFARPTGPHPDSGPPVVGTTWNASDKTAGWTLSGGDLTVSETTSAYEGVRSVVGKSSGKWYWELLIDSVNDGNGTDAYPGIRRSDTSIGTTPGSGNDALVRTNGSLFANGGPTAGTGGVDYPRGSIMMIAIDLDAGKMWAGKNGTWNNSGDPVAGTNATFTTIPAGTWHAYVGTDNNAPKNIVTLNSGTAGFTYTPPTGYSALA